MLFVPGGSNELFMQIPAVAIGVFLVSLIESPSSCPPTLRPAEPHSGGSSPTSTFFEQGMKWFIARVYAPVVAIAVRERYTTIAVGVGMLVLSIALLASGKLPFTFLPKIDADFVIVNARMPLGTPVERTAAVQERLLASLAETMDESGGPAVKESLYTVLGGRVGGFGPVAQASQNGSHLLGIQFELVPESERNVSATEFARRWRENTGDLAGIETISYTSEVGRASGAAVDVQLSHRNTELLGASLDLADTAVFTGEDIDRVAMASPSSTSNSPRPAAWVSPRPTSPDRPEPLFFAGGQQRGARGQVMVARGGTGHAPPWRP